MLTEKLHAFCDWLIATPFSLVLQSTAWIIPTVQTVHILCVAIVVTGILMVNLRFLGAFSAESAATVVARFLAYLWYPLVILLISGALLIIAEPSRALLNWVFALMMLLLLIGVALTLWTARPLRRDAKFWEGSPGRRLTARLMGTSSLLIWSAIVFAGRWIAYLSSS